jgi:hypothetical protein
MGNIDGAASGEPKRRHDISHFSSVDVAPRKRSCTFFYRIYPKENTVYTGILKIKTDEIPRTLNLIRSYQNKCVIWGQKLTENNL